MRDDPTPNGRPISDLPQIASLIDGQLVDANEQYAGLTEIRHRPHVLDDATITRCIKLYAEQRDFLTVYKEQSARWRTLSLSPAQQSEVGRLEHQLQALHTTLTAILVLAEELKQGTIEKVLAKSDAELGLEALRQLTERGTTKKR